MTEFVSQKKDFSFKVTEHWNRLPEGLWHLHPCRYQKTSWTWSWATCCRWPCLNRGVQQGWIRWPPGVHSNLNHSAIHWWSVRSSFFAGASVLSAAVLVIQSDGVPASALKALIDFKSMQCVVSGHKNCLFHDWCQYQCLICWAGMGS